MQISRSEPCLLSAASVPVLPPHPCLSPVSSQPQACLLNHASALPPQSCFNPGWALPQPCLSLKALTTTLCSEEACLPAGGDSGNSPSVYRFVIVWQKQATLGSSWRGLECKVCFQFLRVIPLFGCLPQWSLNRMKHARVLPQTEKYLSLNIPFPFQWLLQHYQKPLFLSFWENL